MARLYPLLFLLATVALLSEAISPLNFTILSSSGRGCPNGSISELSRTTSPEGNYVTDTWVTLALRDFHGVYNSISQPTDRIPDCYIQLLLTDDPGQLAEMAHLMLRAHGTFSADSGMAVRSIETWTFGEVRRSDYETSTYNNTGAALFVGPVEFEANFQAGIFMPPAPCGNKASYEVRMRSNMLRGSADGVAMIGPKIGNSGEVLEPVKLVLNAKSVPCDL